MKKILNFLSGKKTYIIAVVIAALNIAVAYGWITPDHLATINIVLTAFGVSALRAGVTKSGPAPTV